MSSPGSISKFHPEMHQSLSALMLEHVHANDVEQRESAKERHFPRTLSTSVLRIKHRSSFWERFFENHRRLAHGEDLIVTPFAQILASLRSVRNNYICLTSIPINRSRRSSQSTGVSTPQPKNLTPGGEFQKNETYSRLAVETLEELDWCLDQLETIQTHRSVSDMASSKSCSSSCLLRRHLLQRSTVFRLIFVGLFICRAIRLALVVVTLFHLRSFIRQSVPRYPCIFAPSALKTDTPPSFFFSLPPPTKLLD
ncbi:hypothetical protein OUZ56_000925 [Daphnia magna]|uniref:3',5'-cyclic-AMP phosphodiesterase n=1 Tax=Daphnia magna TaxID=35525 RepID=A0ABR0A162_9CRUS|nr:hypothetical protein OUZ56_000925 [Daphnia magna]